VAFLATTYFELERKLNRARCCEGVAVFVDWSSFGLLSLEDISSRGGTCTFLERQVTTAGHVINGIPVKPFGGQ